MIGMNKNIPGIWDIIPKIAIILLTCILCASSTVIASSSDEENPDYQITLINISSEEMSVSPGLEIHPTITVLNTGTNPAKNVSLQFSALLGPTYLIADNALWTAPQNGEEEYTIPFAIPFIQPGEYPLKITVHQIKENQTTSTSHTLKANAPIQITNPKPPVGDCGCSKTK
jgi:hypothetical protein